MTDEMTITGEWVRGELSVGPGRIARSACGRGGNGQPAGGRAVNVARAAWHFPDRLRGAEPRTHGRVLADWAVEFYWRAVLTVSLPGFLALGIWKLVGWAVG